jgi:WD40 repeat protein
VDAGRDVGDLAVSPDGATVYAARSVQSGYSWHTRLFAFDVATGKATGSFPECEGGLTWLSVSADGRRLVGRGAYEAGVWDLTRPDDPQAVGLSVRVGGVGKYVDGVALSADGKKLALVTSRGLELWDIAGREAAQVFRSGKHKRRVSAVACSPAKPLIATGDNAGNVFLWDHAGNVMMRYDWGLGEVYGLAFAPDGLRCAAVNASGKVVIWDVDA